MSGDAELLTPDKAAAEVGWTGKYRGERIVRRIEAKERELGRAIGSRTRGAKVTRVQISRGALRKHFPELFDVSLDRMALEFRKILGGIDAKLDERIAEHPKIRDLEVADARLMRQMTELARRVARIA